MATAIEISKFPVRQVLVVGAITHPELCERLWNGKRIISNEVHLLGHENLASFFLVFVTIVVLVRRDATIYYRSGSCLFVSSIQNENHNRVVGFDFNLHGMDLGSLRYQ